MGNLAVHDVAVVAGIGELGSDVLALAGGKERSGGWRWDVLGIDHLVLDSIPEAC